LTSSLYVPGKLSNVETVIVDVGTGYFVEKVGWKYYILYHSAIGAWH
jgi:Prefoldin subunit